MRSYRKLENHQRLGMNCHLTIQEGKMMKSGKERSISVRAIHGTISE